MTRSPLNIRRLVLDVDKAVQKPSLIEIAKAVQQCGGVEVCNITVGEIDIETVDMDVIIEGTGLDYGEIVKEIEKTDAVVHSLYQIIVGDRLIDERPRRQ
jgi:uncharacterized protein